MSLPRLPRQLDSQHHNHRPHHHHHLLAPPVYLASRAPSPLFHHQGLSDSESDPESSTSENDDIDLPAVMPRRRQGPARPPATRTSSKAPRGTRRPYPTIDLTDSPAAVRTAARTRADPASRYASEEREEPAAKRRKTSSGPVSTPASTGTVNTPIDLLDDEEEERLAGSTNKDAIAQQNEEKLKKLAQVGCIICMEDEVVNLSVTPCGHMFCHLCLHGAIKSSGITPNAKIGRCPVCRGKVALKDIIVLEMKKMSKGKEKATY